MSLLVPGLYHQELVTPSPSTEFKTQKFLSVLAVFLVLLVAANSEGLSCTLLIVRKDGARSVGMGTTPAGGGWEGAGLMESRLERVESISRQAEWEPAGPKTRQTREHCPALTHGHHRWKTTSAQPGYSSHGPEPPVSSAPSTFYACVNSGYSVLNLECPPTGPGAKGLVPSRALVGMGVGPLRGRA